jgi:hypothetical protein
MRSSIEPGLGTSSLRRTSPKGTTQPLLGAGVPLGNFQHGPDLIEVARSAARNWPPGANSRRTAPYLATLAAKKLHHFERRAGFKSPSSHSRLRRSGSKFQVPSSSEGGDLQLRDLSWRPRSPRLRRIEPAVARRAKVGRTRAFGARVQSCKFQVQGDGAPAVVNLSSATRSCSFAKASEDQTRLW